MKYEYKIETAHRDISPEELALERAGGWEKMSVDYTSTGAYYHFRRLVGEEGDQRVLDSGTPPPPDNQRI